MATQQRIRSKSPKLMLPGDLQLAILGCVWRDKNMSLRRIYHVVNITYKEIALSTLSTTITRLLERGYLVKTPDKHNRRYSAGITREELIALMAEKIESA